MSFDPHETSLIGAVVEIVKNFIGYQSIVSCESPGHKSTLVLVDDIW
jgi:hypothetical protein